MGIELESEITAYRNEQAPLASLLAASRYEGRFARPVGRIARALILLSTFSIAIAVLPKSARAESGGVGPQKTAIAVETVDCVSQSTCFAVTHSQRLAKTTDGGRTWQHIGSQFRAAKMLEFVSRNVGCASRRFCVVTETSSGPSALFVTIDGGRTWKKTDLDKSPQGIWCFLRNRCIVKVLSSFLAVDHDDGRVRIRRSYISMSQTTRSVSCPSRSFCSAAGDLGHEPLGGPTLSISTNGGLSWRLVYESGNVGATACVTAMKCIGTKRNDALVWSRDGAKSFRPLDAPVPIKQVGVITCSATTRCLIEAESEDGLVHLSVTFGRNGAPDVSVVDERPVFAHPKADTSVVHCKSKNLCVAPTAERHGLCDGCDGDPIVEGVSPIRVPAVSTDGGRSWLLLTSAREEIVSLPDEVPRGLREMTTQIADDEIVDFFAFRPKVTERAEGVSDRDVKAFLLSRAPTSQACPVSNTSARDALVADGWLQVSEVKKVAYSDLSSSGQSRYGMYGMPFSFIDIQQSDWQKGRVHAIMTSYVSSAQRVMEVCSIELIFSNGSLRTPG